jgi:hypothetical protein
MAVKIIKSATVDKEYIVQDDKGINIFIGTQAACKAKQVEIQTQTSATKS